MCEMPGNCFGLLSLAFEGKDLRFGTSRPDDFRRNNRSEGSRNPALSEVEWAPTFGDAGPRSQANVSC